MRRYDRLISYIHYSGQHQDSRPTHFTLDFTISKHSQTKPKYLKMFEPPDAGGLSVLALPWQAALEPIFSLNPRRWMNEAEDLLLMEY